ncbi:hypothetical protein THRCLA_05432 [Thraustotheca clavata]|uniref:Uncharacterized protein n=1 Tax=Thraustotheca clavata TaxID=74557 RepID=A0A1V9ZW39_9STRA|nr:hypothetical protein THRCLA_05432 [Thraustotheca clavata]
MVLSCVNWIVVFVLEAFIFPYQNNNLPNTCGLATSTSCFIFSEVAYTYCLSAVVSGAITLGGIIYISVKSSNHSSHSKPPEDNSVMKYLEINDIYSRVTTSRGCVRRKGKDLVLDQGLLLMKNVLRISQFHMTRLSNVQYELVYLMLPKCYQRRFSLDVGTVLVFFIENDKISGQFGYKNLHELGLEDTKITQWHLAYLR